MSNQTGSYDPDAGRRSRRRTQVVVGAAGLAAVLGGGMFAVTEIVDAGGERIAERPVAPPTAVTRSTSAALTPTPSSPPPARPARSAATARISPTPAMSATTTVDSGPGSAARARDKIKRAPVPQTTNVLTAAVTQTQTGTLKDDGRMMRVVSARQDLTGLRELAWVADRGIAVGDARCTQRFRFIAGAPVAEKPSLLICWRTSAVKSVYTLAVTAKGRPSMAASVAAIDSRWAAMG